MPKVIDPFMPEGPEIRRAADKVASVLVGRRIEEVGFGLASLKPFEKAMLTRFDNDLTIYSHNQLYGRWYTVRRPRMPKTNRQLRVELCTATHKALLYSASDIAVLDDAGLSAHPFLARVGPDILDRSLTTSLIVDRLQAPQFRNRALGSLYLDQAFLAGNGNYLRSEILWAAGIEPSRKPASLTASERQVLAAETLKIAWRSYGSGGVTVTRRLASQLKAEGLSRSRYRFKQEPVHVPCLPAPREYRRATMKPQVGFALASFLFLAACSQEDSTTDTVRIAVASFAMETCTFCPRPTDIEHFEFYGEPFTGDAVLESGGEYQDVEVIGVYAVRDPVGGSMGSWVTERAFDKFAGEIVTRLAAIEDLDAVYLPLHGAMAVTGIPRPEAELVRRIKAELGNIPIAITYDLHANEDAEIAEYADIVLIVKRFPHYDFGLMGGRAVRMPIRTVREIYEPVLEVRRPNIAFIRACPAT
jgi:endonuclease-8